MTQPDPAEMLAVLGKKYSTEILVATAEPQSVTELSTELDIPIATCYRRVEELADHSLLECIEDGEHQQNRYERSVDAIQFAFSPVTATPRETASATSAIDTLWQKLQTFSTDRR